MQQHYPKISVVTPNYNQGAFLEQTLRSVLDQGYPNLEYIVMDGGSTDDSVTILKEYQDRLHYWVSEADEGMYHALNKGFQKATGEIMCWINSDDVLWEGSLQFVAEVFTRHREVSWLQGYPSVIDEKGVLLFQRDPVATKAYFYSYQYRKDFSFIQQESTFWRRSLWEKTGGRLDTAYQVAADFELWLRFFQYKPMYCTKRQLAAFRKREGQKSADAKNYMEEADRAVHSHLKRMSFVERIRLKWVKQRKKTRAATINWIENL
ncbi:glycosyltransferase family 2 protein [Altibacter sp.]|uniref:glycosyltransferase family 2 protein n=1 Tax=Altibacter sp. TaxID=2024823 RepID=UPI000C91C636|nr:glycosyltransferase family 2 protein [Altibacter sp.]MAP55645.1 glycosyl transferase [Altibacter sp.]